MRTGRRYRQAIVEYLDSVDGFATARDIAVVLHIPYKATIDALDALHRMGRVVRTGAKFGARWGSVKAVQLPAPFNGWNELAATWFGPRNPASR